MKRNTLVRVTLMDGSHVLMGMRAFDHYRADVPVVYAGSHERYGLVTHYYRQTLDTSPIT